MDIFKVICEDRAICHSCENFVHAKFKTEIGTVILHLNIRSARKNFNEFLVYLKNLRSKICFQIIVLTEMNIYENEVDMFTIKGYNMYYNLRRHGKGGGVAIYVQEDLNSKETNSDI